MRLLLSLVAALVLLTAVLSAQQPQPSPEDLKKAKKEFQRGLKLKGSQPEEALDALIAASKLAPENVEYATAREIVRQQLVYQHIREGNELVLAQRRADATAHFRKALDLDPGNEFAAQRLREMSAAPPPAPATWLESGEDELALRPKPGRQNFHFTNGTQPAFTTMAGAYGIKATFDDSVPARQIRIDMDNASFMEAMNALTAMTRTFWTPVSSSEMLIAADTPTNHRQLERMQLRTFYLPEASTPQELNEIANLLRTIFEVRFITQSAAASTITVRASAPTMQAATRFLETLWAGRPQVMLDFEAFQVSRTMLQSLGVQLPLQYSIFNIPASALAAFGNTNVQDLINQLIASGGINQANISSLSALFSQLQNQQNSLFSQPVATFGGGTTLMGIRVPTATANFSKNRSHVYTLQKISVRAAQGQSATFRLGERYPVLNATFAPVFNTPQVANVLGANSFIAPFPSFSYEDLGITVKAKPQIHGTREVTLDLELEIRALAGQSFNGVPVIGNRSYKGMITVANDQPAVMAGSLSVSDQRTLAGLPGFGRAPVLGNVLSNRTNEHDEDELLIVITPHILSAGPTGAAPIISVPRL